MARKIPYDFDPSAVQLEFKEAYTRDALKVNVMEWIKFRHLIQAGLNHNTLVPAKKGSKTKALIKMFPDIGKTHFQAVTNLGFCKQSLLDSINTEQVNEFHFDKSVYDFYFHAGVVLDALGRLMYMFSIKESTTQLYRPKKPRKGKLRQWIDWGAASKEIRTKKKNGFRKYFNDPVLKQIINIRNNYTHNWPVVKGFDQQSQFYFWPKAIRTKRNYKWPYHHEAKLMTADYKADQRIVKILETDFAHLESTFNAIFEGLTRVLRRFEKQHYIIIK